jgi:hypothetical protein
MSDRVAAGTDRPCGTRRCPVNVAVVVVGLAILLALALAVGILRAEEISQEGAWRRIATARRRIHEEEERLRELDEALDRCRNCPFRPDR